MKTIQAYNDDFPVIIIGGEFNGVYTRKDIMERFHNGKYTKDLSKLRKMGFICHREELDRQPLINGYLGPMWDGNKLRYESSQMNRILSC